MERLKTWKIPKEMGIKYEKNITLKVIKSRINITETSSDNPAEQNLQITKR